MMNSRFVNAALGRIIGRGFEAYVLIPLFAALLLAFIWIGTVNLVANERLLVERTAVESSRELIEIYEAQMVRALSVIDQTLRIVKYGYSLKGQKIAIPDLSDKGLLPPALVFTISIANRDGEIVASNRKDELKSVIDEPYFQVLRDRNSELPFVSQAKRGKTAAEWKLHFSKRLNTPDGSFDGIVIVSVDPDYFTSGYEQSKLGNHGVIGLIGDDGIFRSMRIGDKVSWGEVGDPAWTRQDSAEDATNGDVLISPWDATPRYTNLRRLHSFPLTAIVGLSESEQFNVFNEYKRLTLWKAAALSVILIVFTALLSWMSWQLAKSRFRTRKAQETYHAASEASIDAFFVLHALRDFKESINDFILDDMNTRGASLLGLEKAALLGKSLRELLSPPSAQTIIDECESVFFKEVVFEKEWKNNEPSIHAEWLHRQVVKVRDGVVIIVRDITERKRAEILRIEQGYVLEMIATSKPLEDIFKSLTQLVESQLKKIKSHIILLDEGNSNTSINPEKTSNDLCWSTPILSHKGELFGSFKIWYDEPREPNLAENALVDMASRIAGIAIERHQTEERIRYLAHHDGLTGLPNRLLFHERLERAILHAQRYKDCVTVAFIDLDNFKTINDSLGHKAGDELLKTVAKRMVSCVRSTDTVARLGGDEFVIILVNQHKKSEGVVQTLHKIRAVVAESMYIENHDLQVTYSMGLATYPNDGKDIESLLMNADAAMYRAKELGRNNFQFYTEEMNAKTHERLSLQEGLRNALARDEFCLHYQPQVNLRTGKIFGVEALIRWNRQGIGLVQPAQFISLAEETGLIVSIGEWVLQTACKQNKAWQNKGLPAINMSVNVSARQFKERDWLDRVTRALQESGMEAKYLDLELTESLIMQDVKRSILKMNELKTMGVQLSIDDFGTGYSSLSSLKTFPIARLKLDQSFVQDITHNDNDKAIAMSVISLGHKLNLKVLAEGVETPEQLAFLKENDCDEVQGYYFYKPLTAEEIEEILKTSNDIL